MQPDTIVPGANNPQTYNRYGYLNNSPINFTDPSGYRLCEDAYEKDPYKRIDIPLPITIEETFSFTEFPVANPEWIGTYGATDFAYNNHINGDGWGYDEYAQGFHADMDAGGLWNDPIIAGTSGTLTEVWKGWGWNVKILTPDGYEIRYQHLAYSSFTNLDKGILINPDTLIGGMGDPSGDENGSNVHLHLEIRKDGYIMNPLDFMPDTMITNLLEIVEREKKSCNQISLYAPENWNGYIDLPNIQRGGPVLWPKQE